MNVLFVFGTRPEAIKLCPIILQLSAEPVRFSVQVCVTAQHRGMLDQVLNVFDVRPDYDLDVMRPSQTLNQVTGRLIAALEPVMETANPDFVVVQGDTTTTLCGALAAFYRRVPLGHVEAGLRTGDLCEPFPEELNRVLTARMAALHFAATPGAAANLNAEGVAPDTVFVTGNSGIDAVLNVRGRLERDPQPLPPFLIPGKKLILVTAHRRESFGAGFEGLCHGIARIAERDDVQIVFPVHRNPNVTEPVERILGALPRVTLLAPLEYVPFVDLMRRSYLLLTDSGGIQEEGPSLGKPVLVMRDKTERPEAVEAGTVRLVGTDPVRISNETCRLLDGPEECERMSRVHNPYGDGCASRRISNAIYSFCKQKL
ncbi:MAG: UDP-N-acetylglucosamine 2-epimerase (non-hydrolyzing) [Acidobacteriota bacterium]|nr:UDP-N-acetylglucosamine 2-epimerase (non-hydrolyzing) [Acidobacteriota bacterium]